MNKTEKLDGAEPVIVTVIVAEGLVYEEAFSPDATFGEIAAQAAESQKLEAPLVLEAADGDRELRAEQTLRDAGFEKKAELRGKTDPDKPAGKAGTVNVIVITSGENYHGHLPPDTTFAALAALVVEECELIIGPGEGWSIKRPGEVTGLDPNRTLADEGFMHAAKLEFSKDQYQGGS